MAQLTAGYAIESDHRRAQQRRFDVSGAAFRQRDVAVCENIPRLPFDRLNAALPRRCFAEKSRAAVGRSGEHEAQCPVLRKN